jgi:RNA-directed DNA polymerase
MTKIVKFSGAPSACNSTWESLKWQNIEKLVKRLQMRIAKATREGKKNKVKALQWILTHSFYGKCYAVKRVVQNKGATTPGIDNILWSTSKQRMNAVLSLKRRGYTPLPLKRIYIPKKNSELRPLSIPSMIDRGMQALYLLALEPIAEELADPNSYGFRPKRSAADAIEQCHSVLCKGYSAQWVFEGDIKSCFDRISSKWLEENITMDKTILMKFLKAGYIEKGTWYPTTDGTPQGGLISPTLLVLTLSGFERSIKRLFKTNSKVNVIVYADDFVITGPSREILEIVVIPTVEKFLKERGLTLSKEKSKITHIDDGFDFLGFNIRKYKNGKTLTKPSKAGIKRFLKNIREVILNNKAAKTENLIRLLNPKIMGWANYYRSAVSSKVFAYIDHMIYQALDKWIQRRHRNKGRVWTYKKYFRRKGLNNWQFFAKVTGEDKKPVLLDLRSAGNTHIKRHIKIRGEANPYNPNYKEYFLWLSRIRSSNCSWDDNISSLKA